MNRQTFHHILKNYIEGKSSEAERRLIDQWYELLDNENFAGYEESKLLAMEERLWARIQLATAGNEESQPPAVVKRLFPKWMAAAAVILVVGLGLVLLLSQQKSDNTVASLTEKGLTETVNNTAKPLLVKLEDGTTVTLAGASKLSYPGSFSADRREVYLEGEAFFEVSKNPDRPFFVFYQNLVTQVLGTSFTVKTNQGTGGTEVAVRTGTVSVYERRQRGGDAAQKTNGVILTPNQKVIYYPQNQHFVTMLVDDPKPVAAEKKPTATPAFNYDETPLATVLADLEMAYNIRFVVENNAIYRCPFTGDILAQDLYSKLQLICQSVEADYEVQGTQILIKGKGCE